MARKSRPKGFAEPKTPYEGPDAAAPARGSLPAPEVLPEGTVRYFLTLGPKGRVLLPADMRAAMGLVEGDIITAWLKDGEVRMHSHRLGLRKVQAEAASLTKGPAYASDELIAERRAEAAGDEEDALRWRRARGHKR